MSWLTVWGPSIAAVLVSATLTAAFGVYKDWRHRRGVRALITQEVLHNQTALLALQTALEMTLGYDTPGRVVAAFYSTPTMPNWQRTRWDLADVGESFGPVELVRLAEWYVKLDSLTFLHTRVVEMITRLVARRAESGITQEQAEGLLPHIQGLLDYAKELSRDPPPLPDRRIRSGKAMLRYAKDLDKRTQLSEAHK